MGFVVSEVFLLLSLFILMLETHQFTRRTQIQV